MEASIARPGAARLRQPAYGEYTEQPEVEAQHEGTAGDELGRWAQWPFLLVLALLETAWLAVLAYVVHGFVLSPVIG